MRRALFALSAFGACAAVAMAQDAPRPAAPAPSPPPAAAPAASTQACMGRKDVLGLERIVEIDTKGGPQFGLQQYKDLDFLQDGEVVLTFDDGPLRAYTQPVLAALDAHCTRATFFIVGKMAVADPEMVREMARRGHTVGTHTWSHANLRTAGPVRAKGEIELGVSVAAKILGKDAAPFFRFPYLSDPRGMIAHGKSRDLGLFSIDIDSRDFRTRNPADVIRTVMGQLRDKRKGIILFHDIQPSTAGALRTLLGELKGKGFKVVHVVPKDTVTTIAEYDAMAERELSRKMLAARHDPLATRSMVWPVTGTQRAAVPQPAAAGIGVAKPTSSEVLPWSKPAAAAPPPPVASPPPRRRAQDDDDWATRLFRN